MKRLIARWPALATLLSISLLAGCGGGGYSAPQNVAPVANAGPAQTVDAGTLIKLAGSGTDANQDLVSYTWTLAKPANSMASLINPKVATPNFIADIAGTYTATLVVNDGQVNSAPAVVVLTAQVPVAAFVKLWDGDACSTSRRLYVVDGHYVVAQSASSTCSDSSNTVLYESTPAVKLCAKGGIVVQPCSEAATDTLMNSIQADIIRFSQNAQTVDHTVKQAYTYGP